MFLSLVLNTVLFMVIFNISYWRKKRDNPDYPSKSFGKMILFPLSLGIVFTLIIDVFKGIFIYQMLIFVLAALVLYWFFYVIIPKRY